MMLKTNEGLNINPRHVSATKVRARDERFNLGYEIILYSAGGMFTLAGEFETEHQANLTVDSIALDW
jgi:hypothetical protein